MATIFIVAGIDKILTPDGIRQYMESRHVPGGLLWLVVIFEIAGGGLILVGYQTRVVAAALAAYCVLTAAIFHANFTDQNQLIHFMKNFAMAGGFLVLASFGPGRLSVDGEGALRVAEGRFGGSARAEGALPRD